MALFVVLAIHNSGPALEESINRKFTGNSYQIEEGKWIVSADNLTAKQVSDTIGLTDQPPAAESSQGFVAAIGGYFGRARPDLWEWIALRINKSNA